MDGSVFSEIVGVRKPLPAAARSRTPVVPISWNAATRGLTSVPASELPSTRTPALRPVPFAGLHSSCRKTERLMVVPAVVVSP